MRGSVLIARPTDVGAPRRLPRAGGVRHRADSGAAEALVLLAAEQSDNGVAGGQTTILSTPSTTPAAPTPLLAEAWLGGPRQASLARFLALCDTESSTEEQAKAVGTLVALADHDDIVDVTVVERAIRRHDAVVTSNPTHIRKIAAAACARLTIQSV